MTRGAHVLFLLVFCAVSAPAPGSQETPGSREAQQPQQPERPTLIVRQAEPADLVGADDVVLKAACDKLRSSGGTLVLGPGRYVVRHSLVLPANFVLRGEPGAVLALPAPVLTAAAAAAGAKELVVAGTHEFAGGGLLQILPPVGTEFFSDGATSKLDWQFLERVEGQRLTLRDGLAFDIPAGSRVGYPLKILQVHKDGLATIENLTFEGGRIESIPMPGHSQRCAIWSSAPFGFGEQRLGPPGRGVTVRHCRFTDWYGRGVAFYHQVDGLVEGCLFERISDEAIDLDHFVERFRIVGNEVRDALWGIVLNDASRNVVEYNQIQGGEIGIFMWWYDKVPRAGVNEENVIRHNFVRGTSQAAIELAATCVRNVVQHNFVEGEIRVAEPANEIGPNTRLTPAGAPAPLVPPR